MSQIRFPSKPSHCIACSTIDEGDPDLPFFSWAWHGRTEQYCGSCLGDPQQHWGEKLLFFRLASIGHGSPNDIHSVLDAISRRREDLDIDEAGRVHTDVQDSSSLAPLFQSRYRYSPLPTCSEHIRVLYLYPSTEYGAPVKCSIEVVAFDRGYSDFVAMSYTWGAPRANKVDILIETSGSSSTFPVLPNLHHLLIHVRLRTEARRLWIDAICINQAPDNEAIVERNSQLDLMGRIYRQASGVLVWLGLAEDHSDFLVETVQSRNTTAMQQPKFTEAMVCMVKRPWFRRTWIVQELALNDSPVQLLCGSRRISWIKLMAAFSFMASYSSSFPFSAGDSRISHIHEALQTSNLSVLSSIRTHVQTDGGAILERPLYRLLLRSRNFMATDARDRVYGLRGMISEHLLPLLPVDYQKPVQETFRDAVRFSLELEQGVQLFTQFALPLSMGIRTDSWPSWVPNFNAEEKALQMVDGDPDWYFRCPFRPFVDETQSRGDVHHPQGPKPTVTVTFVDDRLITRGVSLGAISKLVPSTIAADTDRSAWSEHDTLSKQMEALNRDYEELKAQSAHIPPFIERASHIVSSDAFKEARRAYVSELSLSTKTEMRFQEVSLRLQAHLLSVGLPEESLKTVIEIVRDGGSSLTSRTGYTELVEPLNTFLHKARADFRSRDLPSEEKESLLLMLANSVEKGDIWTAFLRPQAVRDTTLLCKEVEMLSQTPMTPSADIIQLGNKFIRLATQLCLTRARQSLVLLEQRRILDRIKVVQHRTNRSLTSMVESLGAVDKAFAGTLMTIDDALEHEWVTDGWHAILSEYDGLENVNAIEFRQAFVDMVGCPTRPKEALGRTHVAPRSNERLASALHVAMRNVFHKDTQFFLCSKIKLYGITTLGAQDGDLLVFLFPPWFMPFVLRPAEASDKGVSQFLMVGPAILPHAQRIALLEHYRTFGLLEQDNHFTFTII